jgi:GDP-mannose 4,6-dehydratase
MKRALITGITGQDGSYLADFLLEKGYEVHGIVRRTSTSNRERINHLSEEGSYLSDSKKANFYTHYGDLTDASSVEEILRKVQPDEIYNLGAQSHVRISFDIPENTVNIVALGTLRMIEGIKKFCPRARFYQASSSEMYGKVQEIPQTEKTPFYPRSPYGRAKVFAYWETVGAREAYGLHASNGILFNHESERRGESFVTRKITMSLARIKVGLQKKMYIGNLDAERDWGHSKDFVEAMWLILQQDKPDDYVIGTGEKHKVREFLEEAARCIGLNIKSNKEKGVNEKYLDENGNVIIEIDSQLFRPAEVDILLANPQKAKIKLGWEPKIKFKELVRLMAEHDLRRAEDEYFLKKKNGKVLKQNTNPSNSKIIPMAKPFLGKEELFNVIEAINSGWISSKGEFIKKFEQSFADYCNVRYGVSTSNGTTALHLALTALGIKEGDEVIIPDLTFIATANAVKYCGATPVFVDVHPDYWCINPSKIEEKITPRTKAIIPVHLYGHPCDMDPIINLAKKYNLYIIEDAAEAHGAEYKGKKVGSFGDISCFSFYGNKIITTGEGGMCLTNNETLFNKMQILRDHGMNPNKKYWHDVIGFNYRMTNIQAAIGLAQLKKIEEILLEKRRIAGQYNAYLKELKDEGKITLPPEEKWAKNVYWMYSILINEKNVIRDELMQYFKEKDIEIRPFFYSIHEFPPYKNSELKNYNPNSVELSKRGINLPSFNGLSNEEIKKICNELKSFITHSKKLIPEVSLPELIDRMSIIRLKIERVGEPQLFDELNLCEDALREFEKKGIKIKQEWFDELYKVNGNIWDSEWDVRQVVNSDDVWKEAERKMGFEELGRRALLTEQFMKKRVSLKNRISEETGSGFKEIKINHCGE